MTRRQTSTGAPPGALRAVLYGRVSVSNGSDSLEAQAEQCRAYAESIGAIIAEEYVDDGISGAKGDDARDGLSGALSAIVDGRANLLIVHRLDRLARELHLQEAVLGRVWAAGGHVHEAVFGEIPQDDPSDPMRTFCRQVMGAAAQLERGLIRARMQGGRKRRRAAGYHIGGDRPYGYAVSGDGRLEHIAEEQVVIRRIVELRSQDMPFRAIGEILEREGHGAWHPMRVRRVWERERPG